MSGKPRTAGARGRKLIAVLAILYIAAAGCAVFNVIQHSTASTKAIEGILERYNMKNEGALAVDRYSKEHPFLGMFLSSPVKDELNLPSHNEAAHALNSEVVHLLKQVRAEASVAAWWSWFLITLSLLYLLTIIALERRMTTRPVIFALTTISLGCFIIGILAPAMVIWTAPNIPMETGNLSFVLQHEVRGIWAIIWELLTAGHFIIGGFLLLFSIITPLTKVLLTYFITWSNSRALNFKIGEFLHAIGKWSMADVFVAAILLALYALKFQEATKSIPCLGLYYFIAYCMVSLSTTELLVHSGLVDAENDKGLRRKLGKGTVLGLVAGVACFISATGLYTYEQYTKNTKEKVTAPSSPQKLNNSNLVLPAHK